MTEDITPQNIYQDEDIYANLSDKELKDLYEDLEADFQNEGIIKIGDQCTDWKRQNLDLQKEV